MIAADTVPSSRRRRAARRPAPHVESQSLLDVVNSVIDKGLALDAEIVLGLADIDLVYLRVGALLAAADRVLPNTSRGRRRTRVRDRPTLAAPSRLVPLASRAAQPEPPAVLRSSESAYAPPPATTTDDSSRSVIRLVLTLVEFVRQLLERQAVRRVREQTLTPNEIERLGTALMRLESTVQELAERHGLDPADLNLDLGPLGRLR
jgi:hypothetical protein